MKRSWKIFLVIVLVVILLPVSALIYLARHHHHSMHSEIVAHLNNEFGGKVTFRDFSLSYLRHFPRVHINLTGVSVTDNATQVISIDELDAMLNLAGLWKHQLKVEKLVLTGAELRAEIDSLGNMAQFLKPKTRTGDSLQQALILDMKKIDIRNSHLYFSNAIKGNRIYFTLKQSQLRLHSGDSTILISGEMEGLLDSLISNNSLLFAGQPVKAEGIRLKINRATGIKELEAGTLKAHNLELTPRLRMQPFEDGNLIELHIDGEDNFDEFLGLFEFHFGIDLQQVNPDAKLKMSYNQTGFVNPFKRPYSELDFTITDAVFNGEQLPFPLELPIASGNYNNGESHSSETVQLQIDTIRATVKESFMAGHFKLDNLDDPFIDARIISALNIADLLNESKSFSLSGLIELDLEINGKISELRRMHLEGRQKAKGQISIHDLKVIFRDQDISLELLSGTTALNNHLIEVSTLVGIFNNSAFHFNGHLENLDRYLLDENEELAGSFQLNFDELDLTRLKPEKDTGNHVEKPFALPFTDIAVELKVNGKKIITDLGTLSNVGLQCRLSNDELVINSFSLDYQDGNLTGLGNVRFTDEGIGPVHAKLTGNFPNLDLAFPESKSGNSTKKNKKFTIPDYIHAQLDLKAGKGSVQQVPFRNMSLQATLDGPYLKVGRFSVDAFDGNVNLAGSVDIDTSGISNINLTGGLNVGTLDIGDLTRKLGIKKQEKPTGKAAARPGLSKIDLTLKAGKLIYSDAVITNLSTRLLADPDQLEVRDLHCGLPFGRVDASVVAKNYTTGTPSFQGTVNLDIDNLEVEELLGMELIKILSNPATSNEETRKKKLQMLDFPVNLDITVNARAKNITYDHISLSNFDLGLDYTDERMNLERLNLDFARGHVEINGHLNRKAGKSFPGYIYVKTDNIDLGEVFRTFDNFNQEVFTYQNSSGLISSASHHYFVLNPDMTIQMKNNMWLINLIVHHAEFDKVKPIDDALFFVGHKTKDTMIVRELNINLVMHKRDLYFTYVLMNNNIANLELSGNIDMGMKELDLTAQVSLSDLFFRSKKERMLETNEGIVKLEDDAKVYLKLSGPLTEHKINLINMAKYTDFQVNLEKTISSAEKGFRKTIDMYK